MLTVLSYHLPFASFYLILIEEKFFANNLIIEPKVVRLFVDSNVYTLYYIQRKAFTHFQFQMATQTFFALVSPL